MSSAPSRPSKVQIPHSKPRSLVSHHPTHPWPPLRRHGKGHSEPKPLSKPPGLVFYCTTRLWQPLRRFVSSSLGSSSLLKWFWSFHIRGFSARTTFRKPGLPLPLPPVILDTLPASSELIEVVHVLDHAFDCILSSLHEIQKSSLFWQSRAKGNDAKKIYYMMFERGPHAFILEFMQLISTFRTQGYSMQNISLSAAVSISNKLTILKRLQYHLATFLAQIYVEIDKHVDLLANDPSNALPALTLAIARLFYQLEDSIRDSRELLKDEPSTAAEELGPCSALSFVNLPDHLHETSNWSHDEIRVAVNLIYQNVKRLKSHISLLVVKCQKPRRMALYWLRYTFGAVGLSACTIWLLRHSSLMGSSDINGWVHEAKESTARFWRNHIGKHVLAVRDELFETPRQKGAMAVEKVKVTEDSLHRLLMSLSKQIEGQKIPEIASDQEMLEIVMSRYEQKMTFPTQTPLISESACALLFQIQKRKLDLEMAMLDLDQILKASEINFDILTAFPACLLSVILLSLAWAWIHQDKGFQGRQRWLLVDEVEKKIMQLETCVKEEDAKSMFGLVLYSLDRLYKAVEKHARQVGEWGSLRQDILDIGSPRTRIAEKLVLASRMSRVYHSVLPPLKQSTDLHIHELQNF